MIKVLQEVGDELASDPAFAAKIVAKPQVPGIEKVSGDEVEYLMLVKTRPGQQDAVAPRTAPQDQGLLREEPDRARQSE